MHSQAYSGSVSSGHLSADDSSPSFAIVVGLLCVSRRAISLATSAACASKENNGQPCNKKREGLSEKKKPMLTYPPQGQQQRACPEQTVGFRALCEPGLRQLQGSLRLLPSPPFASRHPCWTCDVKCAFRLNNYEGWTFLKKRLLSVWGWLLRENIHVMLGLLQVDCAQHQQSQYYH